jgi:hypothetical protein
MRLRRRERRPIRANSASSAAVKPVRLQRHHKDPKEIVPAMRLCNGCAHELELDHSDKCPKCNSTSSELIPPRCCHLPTIDGLLATLGQASAARQRVREVLKSDPFAKRNRPRDAVSSSSCMTSPRRPRLESGRITGTFQQWT